MKPLNDLTSLFKRIVVKAGFDPRRITLHCNRSVSSFSLLKRGVITACGTNSRENSFRGRGASGMFWWTKNVLAEDSLEKETCLLKTGYDLPLFFSGIWHYVHTQSNGGKQWRFPKRGYLHPVSPRRVERKGEHMGPIYKRGYGEATRFQCIHLQVKARIRGILESLIRASLVWRRASTRFIKVTWVVLPDWPRWWCIFFPLSSLSWCKWDLYGLWKEPNVKRLRKKCSGHLSSGTSSKT